MTFLYLKAIHIIFIVTWFAGLFYIPRLFVYLIESQSKPEPDKSILTKQLLLMTSRLWYIITWPSAVITLIMGTSLLIAEPSFLRLGFMHIKLSLVVLLYSYHYFLHRIFKQFDRGIFKYTSQQMRVWNEASTVLLIAIVFLIVVKNALSIAWGLLGLIALMLILLIAIRVYKKLRKE